MQRPLHKPPNRIKNAHHNVSSAYSTPTHANDLLISVGVLRKQVECRRIRFHFQPRDRTSCPILVSLGFSLVFEAFPKGKQPRC